MNREKTTDNDGVCELCEPVAAYDPRPRARTAPESWTPTAAAHTCVADEDYDFDAPLPDGWEEDILNDPEVQAELDRREAIYQAEVAAGTWRGYSTEEVRAYIRQEFPNLPWEIYNG